ncbi:hypothetical protein Tco_1344473 [Tanacetum coccineum]
MSDSEDSTVTYTEVSSPFADLSDIGSPGVDGPPVMPEDPYAYMVATFQTPSSPDYIPGLEEPEQAPPLLSKYHMYLSRHTRSSCHRRMRYSQLRSSPCLLLSHPLLIRQAMFLSHILRRIRRRMMMRTLRRILLIILPTEETMAESSDDDEDDDVDIEDDEEEEHLAHADSTAVALAAVDHVPSAEETEPFETDESAATPPPHPAYWVTTRISIRDEPPTPFCSDTEVARLLAIPTPPPHHFPYADTPPSGTPSLLPIPLPTSSPSLLLPSADHGADRPEVCLPPQKRLCYAFGPRYEVGESSSAVAARPTGGFRDEMLVDMPGARTTDDTELGRQMTEFSTRVRQDTNGIYVRLNDEQTERQLMAGRLNMLYRDRHASDLARLEVMSLCTTVLGQQAVITELQAADRRRQVAITKLLPADRRRQAQFIEALKLLKRLQT